MKHAPLSPIARRLRRTATVLLEFLVAGAFLAAVAHHVGKLDFRPLAAFCLPVLVAFVGFTSLLFVRGNSLRRGRARARTLYAAERSMQATVWYLTGIVAGLAMVGFLHLLPAAPQGWARLALLAFVVPAALMQVGMLLFLRAAWTIAPQLLRGVPAREVWRRVREDADPAAAFPARLPQGQATARRPACGSA